MKAWTIAVTNLRRMLRTRSNIFFIFVFPMLLILALGATFGGGGTPRLGVVVTRPGPLSGALVRQLERTPDLRVERVTSGPALLTLVERGNLSAGVEVPASYDSAIRQGRTVELNYLARPGLSGGQLGQAVRGAVAAQAAMLSPGRDRPQGAGDHAAARRPRRGAGSCRGPPGVPGLCSVPRRDEGVG